MTPVRHFEGWLKRTIGLDAASIGASTLTRVLKCRQDACGIADPLLYWEHARNSDAEQRALIDEVVVPETWFFRDREAFAALARVSQPPGDSASRDGVLRALSLPCSTGEEPYSMVIALAEAGRPLDRVHVDAVDISERAIAAAREGTYGSNSFRGADVEFRDAHFSPVGGSRHRLADAIKTPVTFFCDNIFSPTLLSDRGPYDIVFCRNLLIYFDRPTQARAVDVLERLVAPSGFLFVGGSETGILIGRDFRPAKLPMAFAFRRGAELVQPAAAPARHPAPAERSQPAPASLVSSIRSAAASASGSPIPSTPAIGRSVPAGATPIADHAELLADQGAFADAATACEASLRTEGPSARVFYLLGLLRDATGRRRHAEEYYRKALYLDPHHAEAAMHLALLMDQAGKPSEAAVLRSRVKRIASYGERQS